ncbi:hypothetical protein AG4045_024970, partial [Apium graveolens]
EQNLSDNLVANTMSKAEREVKKPVAMESYAWIQTADGSVQEVEFEVAIACPRIRHEMESGAGTSKNNPITLPEKITPTTLSLVIDYCRFHAGRHSLQAHESFNENFLQRDARILLELLKLSSHLQLGKLFKDTKNALAEKICNKPTEEICRMLNPYLTEDLSKAKKSNLRECPKYETRTRLRKKLYSNRRESLVKNVEQLKDFLAGVNPSQDKDTREVDDLVSFVNGDGVWMVVWKMMLIIASEPTVAHCSLKDAKDINATDSANSSGSSSNTADLLGTQDESCNVKEDTFYDNLDPVKDAETTRMVEELARLLNLDPTQIYGDPEVDFHVTDYDKE